MQPGTQAKNERIDIRTTTGAKRLLQEAASARSKTVTQFVLDVALAEAAEVLAEKRLFPMDDAQWAAFEAALDGSEKARPGLAALLSAPSVFE